MAQLSVNDVGEDLHVAMGMHAEAAPGADPVFIDDPQSRNPMCLAIVVIGKRKTVVGSSQPWLAWPRSSEGRMVIMVFS